MSASLRRHRIAPPARVHREVIARPRRGADRRRGAAGARAAGLGSVRFLSTRWSGSSSSRCDNVSPAVEQYIVALVFATRNPERYDQELAKWIHVGVSPRGGIGLDRVSRAYAWLAGRNYVTPDDVRAVVHDVFRHRLILSYEEHAEGVTANQVIARVVERVTVA